MPLYEYRCTSCEQTFEVLRPMAQREEEACCPACGQLGDRRLSVFAAFSSGSVGQAEPLAGMTCACGGAGCGCRG